METCLSSDCSNYLSGPIGQIFSSSIQFLFAAQCLINDNWPEDATNTIDDLTFDYIVIGAGSAGAAVAARLSEDSCRRVLLVEAGGVPPFESQIVLGSQQLIGTQYDWQYTTETKCRFCLSSRDQRCQWPRGKMLGGTSSLNGQVYARGHYTNYDDIGAAGNEGWNSDIVIEYFKKSENLTDPPIENDPYYKNFHGYSGPLGVSRFNGTDPLKRYIINAFGEIGIPETIDIGDLKNFGIIEMLGTVQDGRRESTGRAFLVPARDRPNLVILMNTLATKIVFDGNTAVGAILRLSNGTEITVTATKEVIVSCGTINSPQLLMLSGVGPSAHLEEFDIPVVADLAVGENLHDHICIPNVITLDTHILSDSIEQTALDVAEYIATRKGPYAGVNLFELMTYYRVSGNDITHPPDLQFQYSHFPRNSSNIFSFYSIFFGLDDETCNSIKELNMNHEVLTAYNALLNFESRGYIKLASTDPLEHPIIFPNYFSAPEDIDILIQGADLVSKFVNTPTMQAIGAQFNPIKIPACDDLEFKTVEYWKCAFPYIGVTLFHFMGTSKMGPSTDPKAVVDAQFRVHGIKNLRVADASVFPSRISANTNAPSIMVGERAADFIKEAHRCDVCE